MKKDQFQHTEINTERLEQAVAFAETEGIFQRLQALYATIPEGECGGCADCCMESVETHWVEFLQIYAYLRERTDLLHQLIPTIVRFYLLDVWKSGIARSKSKDADVRSTLCVRCLVGCSDNGGKRIMKQTMK